MRPDLREPARLLHLKRPDAGRGGEARVGRPGGRSGEIKESRHVSLTRRVFTRTAERYQVEDYR